MAKDKLLAQREDELRSAILQAQENERKLRQEYDTKLAELKEKSDIEKENAKKSMKELTETGKREERLLSSAIYEMGSIINQMMREKKKDFSGSAAQAMLSRLAEEQHKSGLGSGTSFISLQTSMRAQSNTKKI